MMFLGILGGQRERFSIIETGDACQTYGLKHAKIVLSR